MVPWLQCLRPLTWSDRHPSPVPNAQLCPNTGLAPRCSPHGQIYPPPAADVFLASCLQKPDLCRNPQTPEGPPPGGETQKERLQYGAHLVLENPAAQLSSGLRLEGSSPLNHKLLLCSAFLSIKISSTCEFKCYSLRQGHWTLKWFDGKMQSKPISRKLCRKGKA